jgi:hypothetical protein
VNLGSRASYRHGGRDPLPTDLVVTPLFKALTGKAPETRSPTEPRHSDQSNILQQMYSRNHLIVQKQHTFNYLKILNDSLVEVPWPMHIDPPIYTFFVGNIIFLFFLS